MLPAGPLVIVIVLGGAEWTKKNPAPISIRLLKTMTPTVPARLIPKLSVIMVNRFGFMAWGCSAADRGGMALGLVGCVMGN